MSDSHGLENRPAKRTRLSTNEATESLTTPTVASSSSADSLQRHPEIWFDDGNIVLVAQETVFRIYRGLLSEQSTVFSDMFASSTSNPSETFNGCPVVHLSDSPSDLACLLRVLLPTSHIQYHTPKAGPAQRTFDEVFAVIRLAHKYGIQPVQDQALAYVKERCYPSDFDAFSSSMLESDSPLLPVHAIGAVNLARLTDALSILPLALYWCASLDSNTLLNGWTRGDGTIERLSDADLRRCLDGRVALARERFFFVSYLFEDLHSGDCQSTNICGRNLRFFDIVATRSRSIIQAEDEDGGVLRDWEPLIRSLSIGVQSVCDQCVEMLLRRALSGRKRLWNRLPAIFGIDVEGWEKPDVQL